VKRAFFRHPECRTGFFEALLLGVIDSQDGF
jgi:hypothetical protein